MILSHFPCGKVVGATFFFKVGKLSVTCSSNCPWCKRNKNNIIENIMTEKWKFTYLRLRTFCVRLQRVTHSYKKERKFHERNEQFVCIKARWLHEKSQFYLFVCTVNRLNQIHLLPPGLKSIPYIHIYDMLFRAHDGSIVLKNAWVPDTQ